jgi:hypothetical protein
MLACHLVHIVRDARPFRLEPQPRIVAQRQQLLFAEDELDDGCTVGVFSQESRSIIVKHRHGVKYAKARCDARRLGDRRVIIDDMHQRYAVEDDVESGIRLRQPGSVAQVKSGRRIVRAGTVDHRLRIIYARIADAVGKQRGKYLRIPAAAAANLEQARMRDGGCSYGFGRDPKTDPRFAAFHVGDQPPVSAFLSRCRAGGKLPG